MSASALLKTAASQAATAAQEDASWTDLYNDMEYLASLPETGLTQSQLAQANTDLQGVQTQCAGLGVNIGN